MPQFMPQGIIVSMGISQQIRLRKIQSAPFINQVFRHLHCNHLADKEDMAAKLHFMTHPALQAEGTLGDYRRHHLCGRNRSKAARRKLIGIASGNHPAVINGLGH